MFDEEQNPPYNCRKRAAKLLSYRPMSRGELRRKLILKGEPEDAATDAVDYLAGLGYLDDEQYALDVVRYYARKGYNMWRLRQELVRHLIPRDYHDYALEVIAAELAESADDSENE
jgi:SOS response regulatory protein OraA/RecX